MARTVGSSGTGLDRMTSEVTRLAAEGLTQQQIADELGVSQPTVGNHLRRAQSIATENLLADEIVASTNTLSRRAGLPALDPVEHDDMGRQVDALSPQAARIALLDLVNPAIRRIGEILDRSRDERVVLQAAQMVLDRTGHHARVEVEVTDAREVLFARLMALKAEHEAAHPMIEGTVVDTDDIL